MWFHRSGQGVWNLSCHILPNFSHHTWNYYWNIHTHSQHLHQLLANLQLAALLMMNIGTHLHASQWNNISILITFTSVHQLIHQITMGHSHNSSSIKISAYIPYITTIQQFSIASLSVTNHINQIHVPQHEYGKWETTGASQQVYFI